MSTRLSLLLATACACAITGIGVENSSAAPDQPSLTSSVMTSDFGKMPDGRPVKLFTLTNTAGTEARITEYGAILVSLKTADRDGTIADITNAYDDL